MASTNGTSQRAAASTILDVVPQINRWAETRVSRSAEGFRLSLRQLSALSMIEDEKTTLGDVARALRVTPAVVTGLIDRLENRGYVRRINSTEDRRRVLLALTPAGREAADDARAQLVNELGDALESLNSSELGSVTSAMTSLRPVAKELESSTI